MGEIFKKTAAVCLAVLIAVGFYTEVCAVEGGEKNESAVARMVYGFENFEENIDLSDFNIAPDELGMIFSDATKNAPYLFYVDNHLSYTYKKGGCVVSVMPRYNVTRDEASVMTEFCRSEIKKLSNLAGMGDGELERVRLAHDLICMRYSYDLTLENKNMYSFLKYGSGTCQGYTWTYMAVLRELGIECEYAASDLIDHIWLRVRIDGEWYHSDATWDDTVSSDGNGGEISRRHFLFSDKKADIDGYNERYSAGENACASEKYDSGESVTACRALGDIDHSGAADLYDLMLLRLYAERGEQIGYFCPVCADIDRDLLLCGIDLELLRGLIVSEP